MSAVKNVVGKVCTKCKIFKLLAEFYPNKDGKFGVHSVCKLCQCHYARQRYIGNKNNPNYLRYKASMSKKYKNNLKLTNPDKITNHYLQSDYGISLDDKRQLYKMQSGKCAICNNKFASINTSNVDHIEGTKIIRGLLCGHCNRGIGLLNHSVDILISAINYLNREEFLTLKIRYRSHLPRHKKYIFVIKQNYRCGVCYNEFMSQRDMNADHDKNTGYVRGVLCRKCNLGIGLLKDNPDILRSATDYLNSFALINTEIQSKRVVS